MSKAIRITHGDEIERRNIDEHEIVIKIPKGYAQIRIPKETESEEYVEVVIEKRV